MTDVGLRRDKLLATLELRALPSMRDLTRPPPSVLYHYTDVAGAAAICTRKALWLDKVRALGDMNQIRLAGDLFRAHVHSGVHRTPEATFLHRCADQVERLSGFNLCVLSLCDDGDIEPRWRAGAGVALGFKGSAIKAFEHYDQVCLCHCIDNADTQREVVAELAALAQRAAAQASSDANALLGQFMTVFVQVASILTAPQPGIAHEWRLVALSRDHRARQYNVRVNGNELVEYYTLDFPEREGRVDMLTKIVIGPGPDAGHLASALRVLLYKNRYDCGVVEHSQVPY